MKWVLAACLACVACKPSGPSQVVDPSDRFVLEFDDHSVGAQAVDRGAWESEGVVLSIQRTTLDRARRRLEISDLGEILSRRHEVEGGGTHAFYECALEGEPALCGTGQIEHEGALLHRRDVLVREADERLLWLTVTGRSTREVDVRFRKLEETFEWKS